LRFFSFEISVSGVVRPLLIRNDSEAPITQVLMEMIKWAGAFFSLLQVSGSDFLDTTEPGVDILSFLLGSLSSGRTLASSPLFPAEPSHFCFSEVVRD